MLAPSRSSLLKLDSLRTIRPVFGLGSRHGLGGAVWVWAFESAPLAVFLGAIIMIVGGKSNAL
jgi:hypothetical protein